MTLLSHAMEKRHYLKNDAISKREPLTHALAEKEIRIDSHYHQFDARQLEHIVAATQHW